MARAAARAASESSHWLSFGDAWVMIQILVRPSAARRGVVEVDPRGLVIALNSPPEKGKANDELVSFLARELRVARSEIAISRGATSRHKTVRIESCDPASITARLEALARTAS